MTGKILAGVSLSLALVTCVAMGVQGGDNDWENGCVQETCGTEGQKMTEQVRPLEIIVDEPDMEDIPEQNEDEPSAEESVDGEESGGGEEKTAEESTAAEIENFPVINQMPELPTGCEITVQC